MADLSEKPGRLLKPMVNIPAGRLMLGTGPGNMSPRVLAACSLPQLAASPVEPQSVEIMSDIRDGIRYAFQTSTPYALCVSGPGNAGMEASCCSLLEPGEVFLILITGFFGEKMKTFAQKSGVDSRCIYKPNGSIFSLTEIEQALAEHKPQALFVVYGESSTGVLQPLESLGRLCHKYGCLLVVDAITTVGVVPLYMDEWEIDVVFTGGQKVLGALTGITPLAVSEAAWTKMKARKKPVTPMFFDLTLLAEMWGCFGNYRNIHSPFYANIYTLREALAELVEEGLDKSWDRHNHCVKILHEGLTGLEFTFAVENSSDRLPTITVVRLPAGFNGDDGISIRRYLNDRFNILVSPGIYPPEEVNMILRIGIMGYNARPEVVNTLITALTETLQIVRENTQTKVV